MISLVLLGEQRLKKIELSESYNCYHHNFNEGKLLYSGFVFTNNFGKNTLPGFLKNFVLINFLYLFSNIDEFGVEFVDFAFES